jgi:hypothetical protein
MTVLIDPIGHMVSTLSLKELHVFAWRIGLKWEWFQGPPQHRIPHYDLTTARMIRKAIDAGAEVVQSRELVDRACRISTMEDEP